MQFGNPIIGQEELIRSAIKSKNYTPGASGWRIASDGAAEFAGLVIRSADGTGNYVTVSNGNVRVFNSANVLLAEITATGEFKTYNITDTSAAQIRMRNGQLEFPPASAYPNPNYPFNTHIFDPAVAAAYSNWVNGPTAATRGSLRISSSVDNANTGDYAGSVIQLFGRSLDGTSNPEINSYNNAGGGARIRWDHQGQFNADNYPDGPWTAFTPAWVTSNGLNPPAFGNATVNCDWTRHGRTITARYEIVFGTTTNFGAAPTTADNWRIGIPVAASATTTMAGWFELNQSTAARCVARARLTTVNHFEMEISSGRPDGGAITNTGIADSLSPWTWASANSVRGIIHYDAAV